jgi:hypothetical protein
MPVVYSGNDQIGFSSTNMNTRSDDEIAWQNAHPYQTYPGAGAASGSGNPADARRLLSGLSIGGLTTKISAMGGMSMPNLSDKISFGSGASGFPLAGGAGSTVDDWRVRISVLQTSGILYWDSNPGILQPLLQTDGVIFPYVPNLTVSHSAKYGTQPLTHTNYSSYFYEASEVAAITINADFTVQNTQEAMYFLAALYFFRASTKMFYGASEQYQGSPPPIVFLNGYGSHYLPNISCVTTSFSHTMPPEVDYIEVTIGGSGTTRVPTSSTFNLTLQPVLSRAKQREFNHAAFARGTLITGGYL